jgi:hypothetical protein
MILKNSSAKTQKNGSNKNHLIGIALSVATNT